MVVLIIAFVAVVSGCSVTGEPTEFGKACDLANDGKTLQVSGVLIPRTSIFCSDRGGRMECPFDLKETVEGQVKITADIAVGSGADTVDQVPKGFKKEDLKVRDNAGNTVTLETDVIKATGKMSIAPAAPDGQGVCMMQVYKIER